MKEALNRTLFHTQNTVENRSDLLEGSSTSSIKSCLCWKCLDNVCKTWRRGVLSSQHPVAPDPLAGWAGTSSPWDEGWRTGLDPTGCTSSADPSPPCSQGGRPAGSSVHKAFPQLSTWRPFPFTPNGETALARHTDSPPLRCLDSPSRVPVRFPSSTITSCNKVSAGSSALTLLRCEVQEDSDCISLTKPAGSNKD